MSHTNSKLACLIVLMLVAPLSFPADEMGTDRQVIERGQYLTTILGCGGCHTEGALLGQQRGPWLAGSKIGIAYQEDEEGFASAVVFPSNLTADPETGMGRRSEEEIIDILRSGIKHNGEITNPVMPWENYRLLAPADTEAIAAYLKSLPAVKKTIPRPIAVGQPIDQAYVRIGVYLFIPDNISQVPSAEERVD